MASSGADFSTTGNTSKKILDSKGKEVHVLEGAFADGGVIANNPTLAAIAFGEQVSAVTRLNSLELFIGPFHVGASRTMPLLLSAGRIPVSRPAFNSHTLVQGLSLRSPHHLSALFVSFAVS